MPKSTFPTGLPRALFPAVGGNWPADAGEYLDHEHPTVIVAALAHYAETRTPVSEWARNSGFQSSGQLKASMNRWLKGRGLPTFTKSAALFAK